MSMLLRPNPSSGVPLYQQLADQVKRAIATGAFRIGELLPDVRPLAAELVISPGIVTQAYRSLALEGVIHDLGRPAVASRPAPAGGAEPSASALRDTVARLTTAFENEVAGRVKRDHELESAREVQQRLMPQECPAIAGLDYAGTCRPALSVGGDYYDFIPMANGLGVAIGDVCGKGVPAALLMATLRALVRGQTLRDGASLPDTMATLNRLIFESSLPDRYASLFYASYDASTRTLDYVNAGHPPPLVFRTSGNTTAVIRLDVGGPVIGWMPTLSWTAGRIVLQPGDRFVAYTDGITEAMNRALEEWGEDRLQMTVANSGSRRAREIVDAVVSGADDFAARAAQHDDMTVVAMRIF